MSETTQPAQRVLVPAARVPLWLAGFAHRHAVGDVTIRSDTAGWRVSAGSGRARVVQPSWPGVETKVGNPAELADVAQAMDYLVLVVRRAGYMVAAIAGGQVVVGRSSGRHIHGRTAAGGWSQKRYERRRGNQADEVAAAAAAQLAQLMAGRSPLFVATGGDRPLVVSALKQFGAIQADRASGASELVRGPHFQIGTPGRADLAGLPERATEVLIEVLPDLGT